MRLAFSTAVQVLFITMMIITVTVVAASGYHQARSSVVDLSAQVIDEVQEKTRERLVERYAEVGDSLALLAAALSGMALDEDRERVLHSLWQLTQQSSLRQSAFLANREGHFLEARSLPNPATRFATTRGSEQVEEWVYRDPDFAAMASLQKPAAERPRPVRELTSEMATMSTRFSEIHELSLSGEPGVTVSRAYAGPHGVVAGVIGVEIPLSGLDTLLADYSLGAGSTLLIINAADKVIAHPFGLVPGRGRDEPGKLPEVSELRQDWIGQAWAQMETDAEGNSEVVRLDLEPGQYLVQKKRLTEHLDEDWYVFLMVPEHVALAGVSRALHTSVTLALIMMAVAAYLIFVTSGKLTRPLRQMVDNARLLEELRFNELEPVQTDFNEFKTLDRSLRQMASSLMAFRRYVPTALLQRLHSEKKDATLGAESRPLVLLSTGITGFTKVGTQMDAKEQADYLTRYQGEVFESVHRNGGAIDKFIDDRVIAFWGAPDAAPNDVYRACEAALECQIAIHELSQRLRWEDHPAMQVRIGLHRDVCMVGNFGTEDRMFYSVVGSAVSVNLWLSKLNKRYGTTILASHAIREETARDFIWRWVDRVGVFDHEGIFDVHELCGHADDPSVIARRDYISRYEAALELRFVKQDPDAALDHFYALQEQHPGDPAVAWQIDSIRKAGGSGET